MDRQPGAQGRYQRKRELLDFLKNLRLVAVELVRADEGAPNDARGLEFRLRTPISPDLERRCFLSSLNREGDVAHHRSLPGVRRYEPEQGALAKRTDDVALFAGLVGGRGYCGAEDMSLREV